MNRSILSLPLLVGCVVAWLFLLRPTQLGGPADYVIVNGHSMQPTMYTGDLAITRAMPTYHTGEIVAFRVEGGRVIHRIVAGSATEGFKTRGDNNPYDDPWTVYPSDIIGERWIYIPRGGKFILGLFAAFRRPVYIAAFAAGLMVLLLATDWPSKVGNRTRTERLNRRRRSLGISG